MQKQGGGCWKQTPSETVCSEAVLGLGQCNVQRFLGTLDVGNLAQGRTIRILKFQKYACKIRGVRCGAGFPQSTVVIDGLFK